MQHIKARHAAGCEYLLHNGIEMGFSVPSVPPSLHTHRVKQLIAERVGSAPRTSEFLCSRCVASTECPPHDTDTRQTHLMVFHESHRLQRVLCVYSESSLRARQHVRQSDLTTCSPERLNMEYTNIREGGCSSTDDSFVGGGILSICTGEGLVHSRLRVQWRHLLPDGICCKILLE